MNLSLHQLPCVVRTIAIVAAVVCGRASAFPPAPTFTIHGVARDAFGWALTSNDRATVVLKANGVVVATSPVGASTRPSENFRLAVPMDTRQIDSYRLGAQTTGNLFAIEVRFPNTTLPVATVNSADNRVGKPGEMLFIDFTLGSDSDGDGIPDAWEWWQLSEMGIGPGHELWSLNTFGKGDFDGNGISDYVEYLAGTFAFLSEETFALKIEGFDDDRSPRLVAFLVSGKTYRVESTTDMKTWTRVPVRLDPAEAESRISFTSADTREASLWPADPPANPATFYRLVLLR